jgi:chromosome partitioning protein
MGKTIALSNHKGGVGKTTSVVNIGAGLANLGKKVLLVDLDPQANLTLCFGITKPETNIYEAMKTEGTAIPIKIYENLDIIPSTLDLSAAETEFSAEAGREYLLEERLAPLKANYDFIFIDCPPSLGLLTINALTTADEVYIPLQAHFLAIKGLTKIIEVINKIKKRINNKIEITGVFITQYDRRKILHRDVEETVITYFHEKVFDTKIRENIALAEAPSAGLDIFRYNAECFGSEDYLKLCKEILERQ